jgi:hypothetical protein
MTAITNLFRRRSESTSKPKQPKIEVPSAADINGAVPQAQMDFYCASFDSLMALIMESTLTDPQLVSMYDYMEAQLAAASQAIRDNLDLSVKDPVSI